MAVIYFELLQRLVLLISESLSRLLLNVKLWLHSVVVHTFAQQVKAPQFGSVSEEQLV